MRRPAPCLPRGRRVNGLLGAAIHEHVDAFIEELRQPGAFPEQESEPRVVRAVRGSGITNTRPLMHVPHTGRGFR